MECSYRNRSHWKNISKDTIRIHLFVVHVLIYPMSKFGGNRIYKFPISFSFLRCPLQVKKLIPENSAKYVYQTGNFYFRPKLKTAISLPIFNLFQWFLFYTRDFIWFISLTQKSKFEDNFIVDLKVYCNLNATHNMCIFYFWCAKCNSKCLLERDCDQVKKAEKAECLERSQKTE